MPWWRRRRPDDSQWMTLIYFNVGQFKTVINYPVDSGTEVDMSTPSLYAPRLPVLNDPSSVCLPLCCSSHHMVGVPGYWPPTMDWWMMNECRIRGSGNVATHSERHCTNQPTELTDSPPDSKWWSCDDVWALRCAIDGWMEMLYRRRVDWLRVAWVLVLNTTWLSSIGLGVVTVAARVSREERLQSVQRLLSEVPLIDG